MVLEGKQNPQFLENNTFNSRRRTRVAKIYPLLYPAIFSLAYYRL